jgi:hypothetical protein
MVNMRLFLVVLVASLFFGLVVTGWVEEKTEVLYTSPSGALRIEFSPAEDPGMEEATQEVWVVSTKHPAARTKMPSLEGISSFDDEFHASPNDEWIFGVFPMATCFIESTRNTWRWRQLRRTNPLTIESGHIV